MVIVTKRMLLAAVAVLLSFASHAQSLEKMQWFNEPEGWSVKGNTLTMDVPAQCDYWRISHYGFTVDDGPFYYTMVGGEFEAKVKISGDYKVRFDQAGLMIRIDHENWLKAGIEYVDDKTYTLMRNCWMQDNIPVMVGPVAACPDGNGFKARFENFSVRHLPDARRLEWLKNN